MSVKAMLQRTNLNVAEVRRIQNTLEPLRRERLRNLNLMIGIIAQVDGRISPDNNNYWVKVPQGMDSNNSATFSQPFLVRAPTTGGVVQEWPGFPVVMGTGIDGQLEIKGVDAPTFTEAGGILRKLNPLAPEEKFVMLQDAVIFQSRPLGHDGAPSTVVQVRKWWYLDDYGTINRFKGTDLAADKVDLASYIPAADKQRIVVLFLRTFDNTIQVTSSTVRDLDGTIAIPEDYEECFAQRDAETAPCQAYWLENNASSIDIQNLDIDFRQFINVPRALGFPNPVTGNRIIREGQTQTVSGTLTVTGTLTVVGMLTIDGSGDHVEVWRDHEPSSVTLTTGDYVSGTVADVQTMMDGNTYHVDEVTGVPGYDIEFNFTDIHLTQRFNFVVARWIYDGSSTHFVTIDIWNYDTTAWDQIRKFQHSDEFYDSMTMYMPIGNQANYVDATGNAMVRFYHNTSGNASHDIEIDYVGLTHGVHH